VWLGLFLHRVLRDFVPLAAARGEADTATRWQAATLALREAIAQMRRGRGYARAIDDDGNMLLQANALTAAWPALSGAVSADEALTALLADLPELETDLVVRVQWPPFDEHTRPWPGRIGLYPPGVRENGGQYSHGASWLVDALTALAEADDMGNTGASELRQTAWRLWQKISPLGHVGPGAVERYGLAPHQQAADIYSGLGHEGRGGWSWYTGAAARMLWAAYGLIGIERANGELRCRPAESTAIPGRRAVHFADADSAAESPERPVGEG
jgi:cyclic beta-1,2-glucan synthetase